MTTTHTTINPATAEHLKDYPYHSQKQVDAILAEVSSTQQSWKSRSVRERIAPLTVLSQLVQERAEEYGQMITTEMGKPLQQARGEVEKCGLLCSYYAEHAEQILADEQIKTEYSQSFVAFEPLGIVYGIMPWNFPFWQVFRFAIPALTAGNGAVLKHALNVTGCGDLLETLFEEAGYPKGLFRQLILDNEEAEAVIDDPRVSAVTLTGSERAGMAVASRSGKALKKTVMEMGGSDPFIVLPDADMDACAQAAVESRLTNAGQVCISAKRFIVIQSVYDQFVDKVLALVAQQNLGDPLDATTTIGPLAREDLRISLHRQVKKSIEEGAVLRAGGKLPEGSGFFYPPTVLTSVTPIMTCAVEETFGPLFAIIPAANKAEAIQIANATTFGLGASIWTQDTDHAVAVARLLESGSIAINSRVTSHPALPFGGVKRSGYGRELSHYGIKEFVNMKTIVVS